MKKLVFATRGSALALWQTRRVAELLEQYNPGHTIVEQVVRTRGDDDRTSPLPEIGGAGVFTEALERALLDGSADVAVHSLKDLPIEQRNGLAIGAVCLREDVRDVLISRSGQSLTDLAAGSIVGTSSRRRSAQVLSMRPDLNVRPIRGNVETRVAKVDAGEYAATVLAAAGIRRLGLEARVSEWLSLETFLPAPGQGALAAQCRREDAAVRAILAPLDDADVRVCTDAERQFLALLGGGCSLPVAAYANVAGEMLHLRGFVGSQSGRRSIRVEERTSRNDGRAAAARLADRAFAEGAAALLEE